VELRRLEPLSLPAEIHSDLQVHFVSFLLEPARYLRFRSRVLTASRPLSPSALRLGCCRTPAQSHGSGIAGTVSGRFKPLNSTSVVELPGIEPVCLPGNMPSELPVQSRSFRFSPVEYLRFRFRVLTASRELPPNSCRAVWGLMAQPVQS